MTVHTLVDTGWAAAELFRTFEEGKPELLPLGIDEVDQRIGGLFPGTLVILAMDTGVGKSRTAFAAAMRFAEVHHKPGESAGIISLEDPEDVVGSRVLSWASGVDSMRIRRKDLEPEHVLALEDGLAWLEKLDVYGSAPKFAFRIGGTLEDVVDAVDELADAGCKVIWLDYLQKVRGVSDDRRGEIGTVMSAYQRACARRGVVPVMLSQFSRRSTRGEPRLHHLKESGDIENEARVAILGWESEDYLYQPGPGMEPKPVVELRVAKSTFGGGGTKFYRATDETGLLVPWRRDA